MDNIADRVKKIVAERLEVDIKRVTNKARFAEDLGADSVNAAQLIMSFEEQFGLDLPDNVAETIFTVDDAVKLISKHAAKRK
jgi:acyl carrier protein